MAGLEEFPGIQEENVNCSRNFPCGGEAVELDQYHEILIFRVS